MFLSRKLSTLLVFGVLGLSTLLARTVIKDSDQNQGETKAAEAPASTPVPTSAPPTLSTPPPLATPVAKAKKQKPKLTLPLVANHDSKGLKVPSYDEDGKLEMMLNVGTATRIDGNHVQLKDAEVETYSEDGPMTIAIPASTLNEETRVITSKTKTTIRREDFTITGDSVEFDTDTRAGKLVGNVRMIITSFKKLGGGDEQPPANGSAPKTPAPAKKPEVNTK